MAPFRVPDVPTTKDIPPADPEEDAPVAIRTCPELPFAVVPELSVTEPLSPETRVWPLDTTTEPDDPEVTVPELRMI